MRVFVEVASFGDGSVELVREVILRDGEICVSECFVASVECSFFVERKTQTRLFKEAPPWQRRDSVLLLLFFVCAMLNFGVNGP